MSQGLLGPDLQPDGLAARALEKLQYVMGRQNQSAENLESLSLESQTEWDVFIQSLTPDLPTNLTDFLRAIETQDYFEQLWASIHSELPISESHALLEWYARCLFLPIWIIRWVYPLEYERPHAVKLHHSGAAARHEVVHTFWHCGKGACRHVSHC